MGDGEPPFSVELCWNDERTAGVEVEADQTVLDAAYAAGINHRSGCESGRCGSCIGRLRSGAVEYENEPQALSQEQRENGFVLLCSARPTGACRIDVGTDVLTEAFPELW